MSVPPFRLFSQRACLVRPVGDLDLVNAHEVAAALDQPVSVVLDLSGVGFIDSTAMAVLVDAYRCHEQRGTRLVVCGVNGMPRRAMELMGLEFLFRADAQDG